MSNLTPAQYEPVLKHACALFLSGCLRRNGSVSENAACTRTALHPTPRQHRYDTSAEDPTRNSALHARASMREPSHRRLSEEREFSRPSARAPNAGAEDEEEQGDADDLSRIVGQKGVAQVARQLVEAVVEGSVASRVVDIFRFEVLRKIGRGVRGANENGFRVLVHRCVHFFLQSCNFGFFLCLFEDPKPQLGRQSVDSAR